MPASNLSANTLFHFTRSLENMESILKNNFYPRYCMENLEDVIPVGLRQQVAIPMVCFCDIPLSQIKNHINSYGRYAIGLSKDWAKKVGINPIMYVDGDSHATSLMRQAINSLKSKEGDVKDAYMNTVAFVSYIKKYKGNDWDWNKENFNGELKRFYDEREWRYVPNYTDILQEGGGTFYLTQEEYLNKRDTYNEFLSNKFQVRFEPEDIKYIIVEDEKDVLEIQDKIPKIFKHKGYEQVQLLNTRIIAIQQILEDF